MNQAEPLPATGFAPPAGRRVKHAHNDRAWDVGCGGCGDVVPSGTAHLVAHYRAAGIHQLFCPACCPCTKPGLVTRFSGGVS